jgi:predicted lipoprotein
MSFGLKNAGATYQRAIQTCLGEQIGDNAEAYVNDVVVKTKNLDMLIEDLKQTFGNLNTIPQPRFSVGRWVVISRFSILRSVVINL